MRLDKAIITFIRGFRSNHDLFRSFYVTIAPRFEAEELAKREKVFMRKDTVEWLLWALLNKQIDVSDFDHIETLNDYHLSTIQKDDVVLDIGAGAGLYSLLAGLVAKKVYSLEPLLTNGIFPFTQNIGNITPLMFAFGKNNQEVICDYWNIKKYVVAHDLNYILNNIDGEITLVKCDCEGCEWDGILSCMDFKNIRAIEMEYHSNNKDDLPSLIEHLHHHNFSVTYTTKVSCDSKYIGLLQAEKK